jgi:hypothetical protein
VNKYSHVYCLAGFKDGTTIFGSNKGEYRRRRKVCHLTQLVLPTINNSPIYTSILHGNDDISLENIQELHILIAKAK